MKQVIKIVLAAALLLGIVYGLTGCGDDNGNGNGAEAATGDGLNIFLISHGPSPESTLDDGSFNQGAADGARRFVAGDANSSFRFMQPHSGTDEARLDIFTDAIGEGADVLILPGHHFQHVVNDAQTLFPDTTFIVIDTVPSAGHIAPNLVGVLYAEHESGFLAGYAAVREGFRQLGFIGGVAVPAVVRFGHGFLQGADHAAQQLGLSPGEVSVNFMYAGGFGQDPAHTATANGWYANGTEVIFVAAGAVGFSVMEAAAAGADRWVIGVDVDQSDQSPTVITSAMKGLDTSVYTILNDIRNGSFRGGQSIIFDASTGGVALPMNSSRFTHFDQGQYDAIFNQLASGAIRVNDAASPDDTPDIVAGLALVAVIEM
jgi:basic membrane protein A